MIYEVFGRALCKFVSLQNNNLSEVEMLDGEKRAVFMSTIMGFVVDHARYYSSIH